ncbi:XRE family transcriptional regulator [Streptomyces sp. NBC_00882]|uniref:helix-turn-helix domain-containing protein n=1 Tax=Streptomyces sp. NBC_00882 TaxID=2975856 RepID=UPI00386DADBB|nr:XRE family transcriptional regulator [Streptomyces sp. NBC_00882]WSZ36869.1 XRE family transcriptional regulator [Streptomyces sp. NBC_00882]
MSTKNSSLSLAPVLPLDVSVSVAAAFDGARLTQARRLAGWTKKELAAKIDVTPAAVGQYEAGGIRPRPEQVRRLAEALGMPSAFFTAGRPRAALDTAAVHFRSLRSAPARERERSLSFTELLWELTHALEAYIRLPDVDMPGWDGGETIPDLPTDPQQAARALRARWDLGDGPIPHVVRLLESRGIVVTVLPYLNSDSRKLDGFSTTRLPRPVVVLNDERDDVYRHRFSCAHELGHLLLHGEAHPGDIQHERQADAFAAEFLTPAARLTGSLPTRVDFTALGRLQQTWGVSLDSLLVRCRELGLHTEAVSSRAWRRLKALRAQGLLPFTPVRSFPGEVPVLLQRAFEMAQRKGITAQKLAGELRWPEDMVLKLLDTQDPRPALHLAQGPAGVSANNSPAADPR